MAQFRLTYFIYLALITVVFSYRHSHADASFQIPSNYKQAALVYVHPDKDVSLRFGHIALRLMRNSDFTAEDLIVEFLPVIPTGPTSTTQSQKTERSSHPVGVDIYRHADYRFYRNVVRENSFTSYLLNLDESTVSELINLINDRLGTDLGTYSLLARNCVTIVRDLLNQAANEVVIAPKTFVPMEMIADANKGGILAIDEGVDDLAVSEEIKSDAVLEYIAGKSGQPLKTLDESSLNDWLKLFKKPTLFHHHNLSTSATYEGIL